MTILDRRGVITGAVAAVVLPGVAAAMPPIMQGRSILRFNVLRNGQPFGKYSVLFVRDGDSITATSDVAMSAKVAGVTVFNYRHHCEETWRGGQFVEMRSHSVRDNQSDLEDLVTVVRDANGMLRVTTKSGVAALPPTATPYTHWNAATLKGPLFNPQNAQPLRVSVAPVGRNSVTLGNNTRIPATQWAVRGEAEIDEWYDDKGIWAGLKGKLPDRSTLEYRRA